MQNAVILTSHVVNPPRRVLIWLLVLSALISLSTCDLSSLLKKKDSGGGAAPAAPAAPTPLIKSFLVLASNNPSVKADSTAFLQNNDIYITVPASCITNAVPIAPTVDMETGYVIANPTTPSWVFLDAMPLTVMNNSTKQTYQYTLHVSASGVIPVGAQLEAFNVLASNNPVLSEDCSAIIQGNALYIAIPASVIQNNTPLTPTVQLPSGYAVSSPANPSYVLLDGMLITVMQTSTSQIYQYTLHVSASGLSQSYQQIQSFAVLKSNNSALSADRTATITGNQINIVLPYNVVTNATPLTPTVTTLTGYTMSPSGTYILNNGMTITATNNTTHQPYQYTLNVSVDPNTIAFLHLANPFYYDSTGAKTPINASNSTLFFTQTPTGGNYTLTLNTDTFLVPYAPIVVQSILPRSIGFSGATIPHNAFADLSTILGGATAPYTVSVQSSDHSVTNNYTINVQRTLSHNVGVTDLSATATYIYDYSVARTYGTGSWLQAQFNPTCTTGTSGGRPFYDAAAWISNATGYSVSNQREDGSDYAYIGTPAAQAAANVAAWNNALGTEPNGVTTSGSKPIDAGVSWTISGAATPPALATTVLAPGSATFTVAACAQIRIGFLWSWPDTYPSLQFDGITTSVIRTATYTGRNYVQFNTVTLKFPTFVTVSSVSAMAPVASYNKTTSADGKDWVYTFTMVTSTTKLLGPIAYFTLTAEDGSSSSYYITAT